MSHDYSFLISRLRNGNTSLKETLLPSADAIETLERERDEACETAKERRDEAYLQRTRAERAEAALKEAVEALRPFARWGKKVAGASYFYNLPDDHILITTGDGACDYWVYMRHLRRARAVLEKIEGESNSIDDAQERA